MFNTYQQTLEYLYASLPMFQRVGAVAFKKDLTNTLALCSVLDNPHHKFKSVHVAGTNGKGSTAHIVASVLQSAGYKTGLYTSPHLKSFTERIRVNGQEVSQPFVVDFANRMQPHIEKIKPSFFEITVAMAFDYFAKTEVDIAVIEVGMGGRLDSTNVIVPEVSVITNIGLDHTDMLGNTLREIAVEKAGIIKRNVPVVISERQEEVVEVFEKKAGKEQAPVFFADKPVAIAQNGTLCIVDSVYCNQPMRFEFPLLGDYQKKNINGALTALEYLTRHGFTISAEHVVHGMQRVVKQTGLKGRWQILQERPLVICDTGHNADGIRAIVKQLSTYRYKKLFMIIGMVSDKDRTSIFKLLPKKAHYVFCQAAIPRAMDVHELAKEAKLYGLTGEIVPDVNEALKTALQKANADDLIFVGGSTFIVAELDNL
ncbi:MAG: bifunctional folylpolyglutamate synthase/dihydrofolate synthase [Cyclobacteriaceae bacterium]|nr:bifunctional folylpolyglutamate synthase/dihydrofolate synthase [Cyclobacteriaceae bacterium]